MEINRRSFQGVLNILSFNRHFYVVGFILLALIIGSKYIFNWPNSLYLLVVLAFVYGLTMPLFVSAYVYDFSGFYNFDWLKKMKNYLMSIFQISLDYKKNYLMSLMKQI